MTTSNNIFLFSKYGIYTVPMKYKYLKVNTANSTKQYSNFIKSQHKRMNNTK